MRRHLISRAALVAVLGLVAWANSARAGGTDLYPRTPSGATELPPGYPAVDSSPSATPIRDHFTKGRPLCCWGSFNGYGCQSWRSQAAFTFGSCRTWFGQPCLKGAPPSALPPWAGPVSGYGIYAPSYFKADGSTGGLAPNMNPSCNCNK